MLETLADKAANMSAEEWGDFAGQVLFEVGTEVATAGGAAALTAVKVADKVVDVAKVANRVDDVLDAAKALDKIDDAANGIYLKHMDPNSIQPGAYHRVIHTKIYFENVANRLEIGGKNGVLDELDNIAGDLLFNKKIW